VAVSAGKSAVLKFGGEVVADRAALAGVLRDAAALVAAGWRLLLCHGGGPQANALQERLGLVPHKVAGRRVTDEPTLQVMKFVLAGELSVDVVAAGAAAGLRAVGVSGVSDGLVTARRRPPVVVPTAGPDPVDFGLVGDVVEIRGELVQHLWAGGYTPVVNTLGIDPASGQVFNINADTVASAIAAALKVDHLFLMTGVPGVLRDKDDPTTRIPRLTAEEARAAVASKVIVGGMIPKVEEALANLELGIGAVHILGAQPGVLQAEAEAPGSRGTVLV
jgi:acetylglutamate kinase